MKNSIWYDKDTSETVRRNVRNIVSFNSLTLDYVLKKANVNVRSYHQGKLQSSKIRKENVSKVAEVLGVPESRLLKKLDVDSSNKSELIEWITCYEY